MPCSHTESEYYAPSKAPPRVHPMSGLRATVPQRCLRRSFLQCCPCFRPNARRTASRLHGNASTPLDETRSKRTARTRPASRALTAFFFACRRQTKRARYSLARPSMRTRQVRPPFPVVYIARAERSLPCCRFQLRLDERDQRSIHITSRSDMAHYRRRP